MPFRAPVLRVLLMFVCGLQLVLQPLPGAIGCGLGLGPSDCCCTPAAEPDAAAASCCSSGSQSEPSAPLSEDGPCGCRVAPDHGPFVPPPAELDIGGAQLSTAYATVASLAPPAPHGSAIARRCALPPPRGRPLHLMHQVFLL